MEGGVDISEGLDVICPDKVLREGYKNHLRFDVAWSHSLPF